MPLAVLILLSFLVGWIVSRSVERVTQTTALVVALCGGFVLAGLAALVKVSDPLNDLDESVAAWGDAHDGGVSTDIIRLITDAGRPRSAIIASLVVGVVPAARRRDLRPALFLLAVVAGTAAATTAIKELADRARPELNPIAETLGPSFPSGHSSYSAAALAAVGYVLSRGRPRHVRAVLAGVAAGGAVAVAASRVLLDEHWLSDVVGGLALGWGWFAVCALVIRLPPLSVPLPAARLGRGAGAEP